jgi:hypothetical protein
MKPYLGLLALTSCAALATCAQAPRRIDTSGWKVFRNGEMGFEVKYPPSWRPRPVLLTRAEGVRILDGSQAGPGDPLAVQFFVLRKINPQGLPIGDWYAEQVRRLSGARPEMAATTLGGRAAIRQEAAPGPGRRYDFYVAMNTVDILQISLTQPTGEARLDPMYEAIVSTLRFLPGT